MGRLPKPGPRPTFSAGDWEALCEFLEAQRYHRCKTHLIPERFAVMVKPETLPQRQEAGVVRWREDTWGHGGWKAEPGWRERIAALRAAETRV